MFKIPFPLFIILYLFSICLCFYLQPVSSLTPTDTAIPESKSLPTKFAGIVPSESVKTKSPILGSELTPL